MKILLVIDMQKGFMNNEKYSILNVKIENFISNSNYDRYIFTKYTNKKSMNPLYQNRLKWVKLTSKKDQEISIKSSKEYTVFEKHGYGLCEKDLKYIKSLNIEEIDICGIEADACVYAIALQLWDNGIFPNLLTNYIEGPINMEEIYIKQFGSISK